MPNKTAEWTGYAPRRTRATPAAPEVPAGKPDLAHAVAASLMAEWEARSVPGEGSDRVGDRLFPQPPDDTASRSPQAIGKRSA
jgi:hypothetical protein